MIKQERGSTLIMVLFILLLVTLVGTWAVRGGMTSLNIATNAQAQALLVQHSDAVFYELENFTDNAVQLARLQLDNGMLGFINKPENKGKELVFCIRKTEGNDRYHIGKASMIYRQGTTIQRNDLGQDGYCNLNDVSDFTSDRQAVVTRVSVSAATEARRDFGHYYDGSDPETYGGKDIGTIVVNATSIIPNLSSASKADINRCLSHYTSFREVVGGVVQDSINECLASLNVPYSSQEMEYQLRQVS